MHEKGSQTHRLIYRLLMDSKNKASFKSLFLEKGGVIMLNKKAITLVELLAVFVILGIVAAISVVTIGRLIENTRWRSVEANIIHMKSAIRLYKLSGDDFNHDVRDVLIQHGYTSVPRDNSQLTLQHWEDYARFLLGDYIEAWPTLPNSGVFSYRYNENMSTTANSLRRITLENMSTTPHSSLTMTNLLFDGSTPTHSGHFIMIRFDADADDDFIETATFLLENTEYQMIFRWVQSGQAQNNIWIYVP